MKKNITEILLLVLLTTFSILLFAGFSNAQSVAINSNGAVANSSAMLDVSSTTKGLLIPRMASSDRTAIVTPAEGLIVYDTDTKGFWYYSNNTWNEIPKTTQGSSFTLPYAGSASDPAKVFSITNANAAGGSAAIHGKSGSQSSGADPNFNSGVWGDTYAGVGVFGSSNSYAGVFGNSTLSYGVVGFSYANNYAGIYGANVGTNGIGIMGEISSAGKAIYGRTNGLQGKAAYFENGSPSHSDSVVIVKNTGLGIGSFFSNSNTNNAQPLLKAIHNGNGTAIDITHNGTAQGIYVNMTNASSGPNAVEINTAGLGRALYATVSNALNPSDAMQISTNGIGRALNVNITNANNSSDAFRTNTSGKGRALSANISNNNSTADAAYVSTSGLGHGLYASISNVSNTDAAVYGFSAGYSGITGTAQVEGVRGESQASNGIGVIGISNSLTGGIGVSGETDATSGGIGVLGEANSQSTNGIGIKGTSFSTNFTSGAVTGINYSTGAAVYGESTNGGVAVYGKTTRPNGAAVYGINDASNGHAIQGYASGTNGVGIYGEAGSSSSAYGGYFRNSNSSNATDVMRIDNLGTGNFLSLTTGLGDTKTSIAKSGNITTDGTVTVKGDKGIIRNSGSNQMRYEVIPVTIEGAGGTQININAEGFYNKTVTFPNAFTAAPAIWVGNVTMIDGAQPAYVIPALMSVTSTGCSIWIHNPNNFSVDIRLTYNLIAIGKE